MTSVLLLLLGLIFMASLMLATHRFSLRLGLAPMLFLLGSLVSLTQILSYSSITIPAGSLSLHITSHVFLPVILLGLLVIYVVNGTSQARSSLTGLVLVTILVGLVQYSLSVLLNLSGLPVPEGFLPPEFPLQTLPVSAFALAIDLTVLILVYQAVTNLHGRFPSALAGSLALLAALITDALLFSSLVYFGQPFWQAKLINDLTVKGLAAVALMPLASFYLHQVASRLPDTAATGYRPALDLFTSRLQLEARARYHFSLFQTMTEINQLIIRCEVAQELLDETCRRLAADRNYPLVWIGLASEAAGPLQVNAGAGQALDYLKHLTSDPSHTLFQHGPPALAVRTRQMIVVKDISRDLDYAPWRGLALQLGLRSVAAFPMRHLQHSLGVLSIYRKLPNTFQPEETALLQSLADDLAYALVSMNARHQHFVLHASAENMADGLLITELNGTVAYANPAIGRILGYEAQEVEGKNVLDFVSTDQAQKIRTETMARLIKDGQIELEFELQRKDGQLALLTLQAVLSKDEISQDMHIVINVHDSTPRLHYERRLLTLYQLTAELIQIHELPALLDAVLRAGEALLLAEASAIFMVDPERDTVVQSAARNISAAYLDWIQTMYPNVPAQRYLLEGNLLAVEDIHDPAYKLSENQIKLLAAEGLHASLLIPIRYQATPLAVMGLYYHQARQFGMEERQLGMTVAQTVAIALQNARLYQAENSQRQLSDALSQAAAAVNSSLDLDVILDRILEQVATVVSCRSANIMLVEDGMARVVRHLDVTLTGFKSNAHHRISLPMESPSLRAMVATGQYLLISDTRSNPLWTETTASGWIRSYVGFPLQVQKQTLGFLNINSEMPGYFSEVTARRLEAFAATAASAIQNARLYQDLQEYSQELENRVSERTLELSAAKERIERIVLSVPDAVFVLDIDGKLVQANPAGEALIVQASLDGIDLFSPEFMTRLKVGSVPNERDVLEIKDRAYQALASALPFTGYKTGLVVVFRDVTRFRELDQMKTRFVLDVSHELRTPLTNLTIYLDLMSQNHDPVKQDKYLATLKRETERLTLLIENLLTISRLEAGRVRIQIRPTEVNSVVNDLVNDRAPLAAQNGLALRFTLTPGLPPALVDPAMLTQVLSNLITNAMNYTPTKGAILVRTDVCEEDLITWVAVSVADNGVGIRPEEIQHIFERFYRGSASQKTGAPGTGLGLAISKEIMDRMQGRISVQSEPGRGSTFTLWLRTTV